MTIQSIMVDLQTLFDEPGDTREEIMRATYLALCRYGYAELTIERIGDEFPKSKSLIYHHYDGKDALLLDFLDFMLAGFERSVRVDEEVDPRQRLGSLVEQLFVHPLTGPDLEFTRAMVQLRAQATHDERYRAYFTRSDRFFRDLVRTIIDAGVEEGVFDPEPSSSFPTLLLAVFIGSMHRRVTVEEDDTPTLRDQVEKLIEGLSGSTGT